MAHSNAKALWSLATDLPPGAWQRFVALRVPQPEDNTFYASDVERSGATAPFGDTWAMWRNWRDGEADFIRDRPVTLRNAWVIVELTFEQRRDQSPRQASRRPPP
jgi:hypothetical protein